jgi:hypothetical protein
MDENYRRISLQNDLIANLVYRATDFRVAYHLVKTHANNELPDWPRYFLLSHSIELALKAFLAIHGKTSKDLRKEFGHNLNKLLKEATKCGLVIGADARKDIARLEKIHNNHWARYPTDDNEKHYSKPNIAIEEFERTAWELMDQVHSHLRKGGDGAMT